LPDCALGTVSLRCTHATLATGPHIEGPPVEQRVVPTTMMTLEEVEPIAQELGVRHAMVIEGGGAIARWLDPPSCWRGFEKAHERCEQKEKS